MSSALATIAAKLRTFDQDVERIIIDLARGYEDVIIEWNVEAQLYDQGIRGDGKPIVPQYSARTKQRKREKGQPSDRVTLRDTGAFHRSFRIDWRETEFEIMATNYKAPFLAKRYTPHIFGLTEDHLEVLRGLLLQDLRQRLNDLLHGNE